MSIVLAIDTSTSRTSVALVADGKVLFAKFHEDPLAHGEYYQNWLKRRYLSIKILI